MIQEAIKPARRFVGRVARRSMGTLLSVETSEPVAALTFDDGPHPEFTPKVLDVLDRYQAWATFFMLGENVRQYPAVVQRVRDSGHAIANHSWDHPSFPLLKPRERRKQIRDCARIIAPYGGLRFFRPPYGHQTIASKLDAWLLGYVVVMGEAVAEDWWPREASWMAERLVHGIRAGSIIILHDRISRSVQDAPQHDRQAMIDGLDLALARLRGVFRFVTIPELLTYGEPVNSYYFPHPPSEMLARLNQHPLLERRMRLSGRNAA